MSPREQRALLTRRTAPREGEFIEIGGANTFMRQAVRMLGWGLLVLAVAGAFVLMFWKFTHSLRIAMVIVAGMLIYMYAASRLVEDKLDRRE